MESAPAPAGLMASLKLLAADIKLAHSVFALPFAVLGAVLAFVHGGGTWSRFAGQVALVIACMVLARTWAMLVNRLVDRRLDAGNPRTAGRAFAAGKASPVLGWAVATACAAGFVGLAWLFLFAFANPWPLYLSVPVLGWLAFYSFTKRFTAACHAVLGASLAFSPIAAALAVAPSTLSGTPALWWTAGFVLLWVTGFDVIYALQDEGFDREQKLASIPTAMGLSGAIWAARLLHVGAFLALLSAWTAEPALSKFFAAAVGLTGVVLLVEHVVLTRSGRAAGAKPGLHAAFFTLNGVLSCVVGGAACADLLRAA